MLNQFLGTAAAWRITLQTGQVTENRLKEYGKLTGGLLLYKKIYFLYCFLLRYSSSFTFRCDRSGLSCSFIIDGTFIIYNEAYTLEWIKVVQDIILIFRGHAALQASECPGISQTAFSVVLFQMILDESNEQRNFRKDYNNSKDNTKIPVDFPLRAENKMHYFGVNMQQFI